VLEMWEHHGVHEVPVDDQANLDGVRLREGENVWSSRNDGDGLSVPVELGDRLAEESGLLVARRAGRLDDRYTECSTRALRSDERRNALAGGGGVLPERDRVLL